ncbi:MAG: hypothetical protein QGI24_06295 [Kiritimatiellia bacterium]|jgi:hypothetical protein|nr:hypothetical protein [Kiritimatiellia bacterium]MDP6848380.1 hypothetical protein [Kiritimatiellia bacterium]
MNRAEKVVYLANVLTIAGADDVVALQEKLAIRWIISRIEADASVVEDATRLLASGDYKLKPLGTPSQRSANIEDMIMVALSDGKLDSSEIKPIEKMTDVLGYVQADMDMMVKKAQSRLRKIVKDAPVPKSSGQPKRRKKATPARATARRTRSKEVTRTQKPPRARALARPKSASRKKPKPTPAPAVVEKKEVLRPEREAPPPVPAAPEKKFTPPDEGITIEFCSSLSLFLKRELKAFESADESGEYELRGEKWHYGVWLVDSVAELARTAMAVSQLPKRRLYINGVETAWGSVFGFCACARARAMSEHPAEYCFGLGADELNTWGCRKADMNWSSSGEWFTCGAFKSEDVFVFDKDQMIRKLEENLQPYRLCPFLKLNYIESAMEAMPDKVKVWGRWRFREVKTQGFGSVARNIRKTVHGCSYTDSRLVDGVIPSGIQGGLKIIRRAVKNSGTGPLNHRLLAESPEVSRYT